jgi:hypothetical protein
MGGAMPVLNIVDKDGGLNLFAPTEVLSVILYPDDEGKREEFLVSGVVRTLLELSDEEKRNKVLKAAAVGFIPVLWRSPDPDTIIRRAVSYAGSSWVAGEMLLFMLSVAIHHPEHEVSPTKAVYTLSQVLEGGDTFGGESAAVKERTLWKAWGRFKSAAHFVAIRQFVLQEYQEATPDLFMSLATLSVEALSLYLSGAEYLRRLGEQHQILDPAETWRVPEGLDLPVSEITLPPLPEQHLRVLTTYRPEYARDLPPEE